MTTPVGPEETEAEVPSPDKPIPPEPAPTGPPFGPPFFLTVLGDRVRQECDQHPESVPVVELHLADGATVDLCHLPGVGPQWLAAQFYRDRETCEEMDVSFVPYGLITRVTVSMWHRNQRRAGFDLHRPAQSVGPGSTDEAGAGHGAV